ncbi:hypothetical protein TB2_033670 [Malus domestica]
MRLLSVVWSCEETKDMYEEQLVEICQEVGPVVSFRLVIDRETGKPKGYGFCEYKDEETALSARGNFQGYEINGRQLRVDFTENDKGTNRRRDQGRGGPGLTANVDPQKQGRAISSTSADCYEDQADVSDWMKWDCKIADVATETISLNWYYGDNRPMLVTNCIFPISCTAALMTNDPGCRRVAKMELIHSLRTHHGASDRAYKAAFQEEDDKGNTGVALAKDLIAVASMSLREHIKILAPRVLALSQLGLYVYSIICCALSGSKSKPIVPDFTKAFDHFCIHTGGKAVIEQVGRVLRLGDELTEPARTSLHRFGNTSRFKVGSLVWKAVSDLDQGGDDNPWSDCIDRYPL